MLYYYMYIALLMNSEVVVNVLHVEYLLQILLKSKDRPMTDTTSLKPEGDVFIRNLRFLDFFEQKTDNHITCHSYFFVIICCYYIFYYKMHIALLMKSTALVNVLHLEYLLQILLKCKDRPTQRL